MFKVKEEVILNPLVTTQQLYEAERTVTNTADGEPFLIHLGEKNDSIRLGFYEKKTNQRLRPSFGSLKKSRALNLVLKPESVMIDFAAQKVVSKKIFLHH